MVLALRHCAIAVVLILGRTLAAYAAEDTPAALAVEAKIPLGDIRGRIDHLAIDVRRQRLYVAELGNDSVGVVDLNSGRTTRTLTGLREPQGIGYVPTTDTIYVANGGDGSVRVFRGADLALLGQIALGSDADNVRISEDGWRWMGLDTFSRCFDTPHASACLIRRMGAC